RRRRRHAIPQVPTPAEADPPGGWEGIVGQPPPVTSRCRRPVQRPSTRSTPPAGDDPAVRTQSDDDYRIIITGNPLVQESWIFHLKRTCPRVHHNDRYGVLPYWILTINQSSAGNRPGQGLGRPSRTGPQRPRSAPGTACRTPSDRTPRPRPDSRAGATVRAV